MQNVKMTVEGRKLHIVIDMDAADTPSKSGKTIVIATTRGNADVADNKAGKIGINYYRPIAS